MVELTTATAEIETAVQQSCAKLRARKEELARKRAQVEATKDSLTDNFNQRKKDLQESESNLNNLMHAECSKAHASLQEIYTNEMENMTKKVQSIDDLSDQITGACEFANKACKASHPTQLLSSQKQIINRLRELDATKLPETKSLRSNLVFTNKQQDSLKGHIQATLRKMWEVNLGTPSSLRSLIRTCCGKKFYSNLLFLLLLILSYNIYNGYSFWSPQVDPSQTEIYFRLDSEQGRNYHTCMIQTVDVHGHRIHSGGEKVEASYTNYVYDFSILDMGDGTYIFEYNRHSNHYRTITVTINGKEIKGSPFYQVRF